MTLLLLELNEINFDDVRRYVARGELPRLGALIAEHGVAETTSERHYEELEPWIQWVTAHSGLSLSEHGIFRLGDILGRQDIVQIWEALEAEGISVGAISPMNADNRCKDPAFFMPDPWTAAKVTGPGTLKRLYAPIAQAVNDNASGRLTPGSLINLLWGLIVYARPKNYSRYLSLVTAVAKGDAWAKAMFLDLLLSDVFIRSVRDRRPGFASLFLNAGAHIQHHYLYNSAVYRGSDRNPEWYVAGDRDPVLEVYTLYDGIVGQVQASFPEARLMLATGLHQNPHGATTFYWRLNDHAAFLTKHGVPFRAAEPRMSRDFVVLCHDSAEGKCAEAALISFLSADGTSLFEVDNRGESLFVTLAWSHDIPQDFRYFFRDTWHDGLREVVSFVAIKNGEHDGVGYFLDTGVRGGNARFPLKEMPHRIAEAVGATWKLPPAVPMRTRETLTAG